MFERIDSAASDCVRFTFDGRIVEARANDTIASALLAADELAFRRTAAGGLRGPWCLMGVCYECLVQVEGRTVQACMTRVVDGLVVSRVPVRDATT